MAEATALDAVSIWAAAFCYRAGDPAFAQPPPSAEEVTAWLDRIVAFHAAIARHVAAG